MTKQGASSENKGSLLSKWLKMDKQQATKQDIEKIPSGKDAPLSFGQQRLWFLQQLYPENSFYNYAETYHFKGSLAIDSLVACFETLLNRHDGLRTVFSSKNGQAVQYVTNEANFDFKQFDLENTADEEKEKAALAIAQNESTRSFNLSEGPLTRISIIRLNTQHHIVVFTIHHIITDEGSMELLINELAELYKANLSGDALSLTPLSFNYIDYAYWQRNQSPNEDHLSYWKSKLSGQLSLLDLPHDRKRRAIPSFKGGFHKKTYSVLLSSKINQLAKSTNTTPFVLLLAAFKALLYRYSGQKDIIVGTPYNNRSQVALEKVIGYFIDTLAIRSSIDGQDLFKKLLEEVRKSSLDAFSHNEIPFETLVKTLKPERYMSANPLFQAMFVYHKSPAIPSFGPSLSLERIWSENGAAKFDLTLHMEEDNGLISSTFEYAKDLFDRESIEQLQIHFHTLLESIVSNADAAIDDLNFCLPSENNYLTNTDNFNNEIQEGPHFIHQAIEDHALKNPDQIAVSLNNERCSYKTLNEKANAVAWQLLDKASGENKIVALYADRSLDMLIGIFGILKAGFGYLPLDTDYPSERINYMLSDAKAEVLLTNQHHEEKVSGLDCEVITFESIANSEHLSTKNPAITLNENDLAYVIYTSGSTGKPKGVTISHKNLLHSTKARMHYYPEKPKAFLLLSSFSFDSSIAGIFWTLYSGGQLVLTNKHAEQNIKELGESIATNQISHTLMLPSLYNLLLRHASSSDLVTLSCVIVAGEACLPTVANLHFNTLPNTRFYNEYGPTEATVWCTVYEIDKKREYSVIPIGKPIANTSIYILDKSRNQVPKGVIGEIYIGGDGLSKGYLNNETITNERFIDNPFDKGQTKIYKTGDLGRIDTTGNVVFVSRADNQVKIRGYRIELAEIEENVQQLKGVDEAVVVIKKEEEAKTFSPDDQPSSDSLISILTQLPDDQIETMIKNVENLSSEDIDYMIEEMGGDK